MKIEVFWNDAEPKRAEAVLFGLWSPADDCRDVLGTIDRLRPEGERWTFDLVLTERWGRRVYATDDFRSRFRPCPGRRPERDAQTFHLGKDTLP